MIPVPCIELMSERLTPCLRVIERQYSCICSPISFMVISVFLNIGGNSENIGIRCSGTRISTFTKPNILSLLISSNMLSFVMDCVGLPDSFDDDEEEDDDGTDDKGDGTDAKG